MSIFIAIALVVIVVALVWLFVGGMRWQRGIPKRTANLPDISKVPVNEEEIREDGYGGKTVLVVDERLYNVANNGEGLEIQGRIKGGVVHVGDLIHIAGLSVPIRKIYAEAAYKFVSGDGVQEANDNTDVVLVVDHFAQYKSLKTQIISGRYFEITPGQQTSSADGTDIKNN